MTNNYSTPVHGLELEILMPVHNEAASIEQTLHEWIETLSSAVELKIVVTEDGSTDGTKELLLSLCHQLPLRLDMAEKRRGYAGAVVAGMRTAESPYVLVVDSDGQCDPKDFPKFWKTRESADVVIGWRVSRRDSRSRRLMSRIFLGLHRMLFSTKLHDPSCPYLLIRRSSVAPILHELGTMREGFWWEFVARCELAGLTFVEVPVHHRERAAGQTVVYRPSKIPGIAWRNGLALIRIWWRSR